MISSAWTLDLFASILARDTLVIALAGCLCLVMRRKSAGACAAILAVALAMCVIVPVASLALDRHPIAVYTASSPVGLVSTDLSLQPPSNAQSVVRSVESGLPATSGSALTPRIPVFRLDQMLICVWLVGTVVALVRILGSNLALVRIRGSMSIAPTELFSSRTTRLLDSSRIARPLFVGTSPHVDTPATFGILRPVIVLPERAESWPEDQVHAAVAHELAHVRRWDTLWALIGRVSCGLCWINPLVHVAARRLRLEQERACDVAVLKGGTSRKRYLQMLIGLAQEASVRSSLEPAALSMARPPQILSRVDAIIEERPRGSRHRQWAAASIAVLAIGAGLLTVLGVAKIDGQSQRVDAELVQLESSDWRERQRAAWALGELEAPRAVEQLIALLDDQDPEVRATAAWALGEIKENRSEAALLAHLADSDPIVREMVILAIGELENPSSVESLISATRDDRASIRQAAAWSLGQIQGTSEILMRLAASDTDAGVRREAMRWLPRRSNETLSLLIDRAADVDEGVRVQAIGALGEIGNPLATPTLLALLEPDQWSAVRVAAIRSLGKIGDPVAVDALLGLLRDADHDVRAMAVWSLDEINPSRDGGS